MPIPDRLTVVIATRAQVGENVLRLHKSLIDKLPGWEIATEILLFDTGVMSAYKSALSPGMQVFHSESMPLPIVDSRNHCQRHLRGLMERHGGYGLVLDDDLVWTISQGDFNAHIDHLKMLRADMAFLGLEGDPPIPKEYTRACPLLDALLALRVTNPRHPSLSRFLDTVQLGDNRVEHAHHDLYAFNKENYQPEIFRMDINDFIDRLSIGKATTRNPASPSSITAATGRERGGATLFLNPDVLSVENQALCLGDIVSRRSDMQMALRAKALGFKLFTTPPALVHHRQASHDATGPNKLIADMLGYAIVEQMQGHATLVDAFIERAAHTRWLLAQTNEMLDQLLDIAKPDAEHLSALNTIIRDNVQTINVLQNITGNVFLSTFVETSRYSFLPYPSMSRPAGLATQGLW